MAQTKKNNGLFIGIAVAAVAVIAIIIGVVASNANKENNGSDNNNAADSSSLEINSVDETIEYGDYDGMEKLSKAIQNGEMAGKTVKIEGLVSRPMSSYSIVQANESGSQKIGTQFVIDGASDSDYPSDGDRIVITGQVVEQSPMYFIIKTSPKYIEVK